jgi:hypothetical protein
MIDNAVIGAGSEGFSIVTAGTPIFFNLHPNELEDGWLVRPDGPIFSHDHDIHLEITESVPMTHFDLCMSVLREVCVRTGAHLVIDDLGAGYSNLKLIADLESKIVKLDRALIQDLDRKPRQQKLVSFVVQWQRAGRGRDRRGDRDLRRVLRGLRLGRPVRPRRPIRSPQLPHASHHMAAAAVGERPAELTHPGGSRDSRPARQRFPRRWLRSGARATRLLASPPHPPCRPRFRANNRRGHRMT